MPAPDYRAVALSRSSASHSPDEMKALTKEKRHGHSTEIYERHILDRSVRRVLVCGGTGGRKVCAWRSWSGHTQRLGSAPGPWFCGRLVQARVFHPGVPDSWDERIKHGCPSRSYTFIVSGSYPMHMAGNGLL
jgi:hypothetical protein